MVIIFWVLLSLTWAVMLCSWPDHPLVIALLLMGREVGNPATETIPVIAERAPGLDKPRQGAIAGNVVGSNAGRLMRKFISLVFANSKSTHEHIFETHLPLN